MTLDEMKSAIRNHVHDGLMGQVPDISYSVEQLEEEIMNMRAKLLNGYSAAGKKLNLNYFIQTIDTIPIESIDLAEASVFNTGFNKLGIKVPKIAATIGDIAIEYLGPVDKSKKFKIYFDTDFNDHEYRPRTNRTPYAWLDTSVKASGNIIYLFNMGRYPKMRYMSIRAVLNDPRDVPGGLGEYTEFPCPGWMQDEIISNLTERYVRYYRQLNIPPFASSQHIDPA